MSEYYITRSDRKREIRCWRSLFEWNPFDEEARYDLDKYHAISFFGRFFDSNIIDKFDRLKKGKVVLKLYEKGVKKPISTITIEKG